MDNLYFCVHALAKWSKFWSDKLKLDVNLVLKSVLFRHFYLNFEEEHQLPRDSFFDLKEVFLVSTLEVINKEATCIPVYLCQIENFELDEETSELLDELKLKYAERSRNQQMLDLTDQQRASMVEKKNDTQHQLQLCNRAMKKGSILPFPFERAVILLSKEKRFEEALEICEYTAWWCADAKDGYDGWSYEHFNSPVLKKIIDRIPKLKAKLK